MRRLLLILGSILIASTLYATITYDSSSGTSGNATSFTWSYTVGSGTNRILVVSITNDNNPTVSNVAYNGTALTKAGSIDRYSGVRQDLWYLLNPPTGTYDITFTNGYYNPFNIVGAVYNGVASVGNISTNSDTSTYLSVSITTTQANSYVVGGFGASSVATITFGSGITQRQNFSDTNGTTAFGDRSVGATGTYNLNATLGASTDFVGVIMELVDAGGGATNTPTITPTITRTITQTITPTITRTITPTITKTMTQTITPTITRTITKTITPTITYTITPTITQTITTTATQTITATITQTFTNTYTPTITPTPTNTPTPYVKRVATITYNPTVIYNPSIIYNPTITYPSY